MESRPEEKPQNPRMTAGVLAALPEEVQLEIFAYLSLQTLGIMQETCHYNNNLINDIWRARHSKHFAPTPYKTDNKNQYLAELFYQRAISYTDPDKQQIGAAKFQRFLQNKSKAWTHYYRGLSFFNGFGVKVDHKAGLKQLLKALDNEDYRAARLIDNQLTQIKISNPALFYELMSGFDEKHQREMRQLLLDNPQVAKDSDMNDTVETDEFEDLSDGELFDIQMRWSTVNDSVSRTRSLSHCSNISLADRVSAFYRAYFEMDRIASDPYMTWWLQLAAQAGCKESLAALLSVNAKEHPYVCCALGVIYEFGILHSAEIEPNHALAEEYFTIADGDLKGYIQVAIEAEFGCEEVIALLKSHDINRPCQSTSTS